MADPIVDKDQKNASDDLDVVDVKDKSKDGKDKNDNKDNKDVDSKKQEYINEGKAGVYGEIGRLMQKAGVNPDGLSAKQISDIMIESNKNTKKNRQQNMSEIDTLKDNNAETTKERDFWKEKSTSSDIKIKLTSLLTDNSVRPDAMNQAINHINKEYKPSLSEDGKSLLFGDFSKVDAFVLEFKRESSVFFQSAQRSGAGVNNNAPSPGISTTDKDVRKENWRKRFS